MAEEAQNVDEKQSKEIMGKEEGALSISFLSRKYKLIKQLKMTLLTIRLNFNFLFLFSILKSTQHN